MANIWGIWGQNVLSQVTDRRAAKSEKRQRDQNTREQQHVQSLEQQWRKCFKTHLNTHTHRDAHKIKLKCHIMINIADCI